MSTQADDETTAGRLPAEWEPHRATWLSWPHKRASWPGKLPAVLPAFARLVAEVSRSETVHLNVADDGMEAAARKHLAAAGPLGEVVFHHFPTDDVWCRDYGAIFVRSVRSNPLQRVSGATGVPERRRGPSGETAREPSEPLVALDFRYNAWGGKYPPWDLDDAIAVRMAEALGVSCVSLPMVLEGGSIDVNGQGALLTTESCLLNPNRNPQMGRDEIEAQLKQYLGVSQILWLGDGIAGDDTDGHIDDLTRFVDATTVVTAVEHDPDDVNYEPLQRNLERLRTMRIDLAGESLPPNVIELPMPGPVVYQGERLPASYANFYVANTAVLLPFYRDPADETARETLQACFPDRRVVGIDCTDIVWGLGACHCLTQQVPAL